MPVFLAKLVVPGGAFLSVAEGIWATIMTFVEKGKQIVAVGQAFLASVQRIAAGDLGPAAQKVEDALVKLLPVALGFLARWLHLDGIVGKVQEGLEKVRRPVEKGIDKVLDKVAEKAAPLWARMQAGVGKLVDKGKAMVGGAVERGRAAVTGAVGQVAGWLGLRKKFTNPEGEQHTLYLEKTTKGARPMVASTPEALERYLQPILATATGTRLAQAQEAERARQELSTYTYTVGVSGPDVAENVNRLLKQISELLVLSQEN